MLGKGLVVMLADQGARQRGLRAKVAAVEMGRVLREEEVGRDLVSSHARLEGSAGAEGRSAFQRYSAAMGVVV
jgi:predicted transcriptional regulator